VRALVALLLSCSCATWSTWTSTDSLYRGRHTHVGVRPAYDGDGAGVTLQLSTDAIP